MIKTISKLKKQIFTFAVFALCFTAQNSYAQRKIDALNDGNITFMIQDMTEITSSDSLNTSQERATKFLERHLHKNARFKSTLKYNIPGFPEQENSVSLSKGQFIDNIHAGSQALQDYETSVEIKNIKISKNKTRATVQTHGRETGVMNVSGEEFPVEGNSVCTQIIMLSKKGVIQIYNANCKTVIRFQEY